MSFPVASGVPSRAGIMVPEVWAGKTLVKFYESTVFGEIANTDYEGTISSMGDTVHIRTTPTISISDYVKGQKLSHQQPEPDVVDLLVDKGRYWSFIADRVDKAQADYDFVDDWTSDAASQLKISVDSDILANIYADAHAKNKGITAGIKSGNINLGATGAPIAITKTNILDYIVDMGTVLDEQNVPQDRRWILLPPWACGLVKKSDLKDASLSGDGTSMLRNGRVGTIDRFTIYSTNQLAVTTDGADQVTNIIFGHKSGVTFASQLLENEGPMKHPDFFGDYYRGLQVYGYETIKPEAVGHFYAKKG